MKQDLDPTVAAEIAVDPRFRARPWTCLETPYDVEGWIDDHNRSLVEHIAAHESGVGVCFTLTEGGNVFMRTSADAVILDVEPDARWIAPLIMAATRTAEPAGHIWVLPDDKLIELILGLNSLIASTTLVSGHNFGKYGRGN